MHTCTGKERYLTARTPYGKAEVVAGETVETLQMEEVRRLFGFSSSITICPSGSLIYLIGVQHLKADAPQRRVQPVRLPQELVVVALASINKVR